MDKAHAVLTSAVAAAVTIGLRFLPFLVFSGKRKTSPVVSYLGKVLPFAVMGMLVVYCLKDLTAPFGIPELLGCVVVALLHVWKRSTLLSIGGGTAVYMLLVNFVF